MSEVLRNGRINVQKSRNQASPAREFGSVGRKGLTVLKVLEVVGILSVLATRCGDETVPGVVEPDSGVSVSVNGGDVSQDVATRTPSLTCAEKDANVVTLFPVRFVSEGKEETKNVQNGDTLIVNGVNYTVEAKSNEDGTATVDLVASNGVRLKDVQNGTPFETHNTRFAEAVVETVDAGGKVLRSVVEVKTDQGTLTLAEGEGFKVTGDVSGKDSEGNLLVKVTLFSVSESGAEPAMVEEQEVALKKGAEVIVGGMRVKVAVVSGEVNGDSACVGEVAIVSVNGQRYEVPEGADAQVTGSVKISVGKVVTDKESQGSGCAEAGATVEGQAAGTSLKCTGEHTLTRTRTDGKKVDVTLDSAYAVEGPQKTAENQAAKGQ